VFFWFAGLSFVSVLLVFNSPALDYRLVMLGAVLPSIELIYGGPWFMHTLLCPVLVLAVVMAVTRNRRLVRRRWLGLPIGLFLSLVFEGAWRRTELFWWPAFGVDLADATTPSLVPLGLLVVMELVGLAALGWVAMRFRLADPERRHLFLREGRLGRDLLEGPEPSC
jgi:hypothetical protein